MDTTWASPFHRTDVQVFLRNGIASFGGADNIRSIEDVTFRQSFYLDPSGDGAYLASTSAEGKIDVVQLASERQTAAGAILPADALGAQGQPGWFTSRTQDPAIGNSFRLTPKSMMCLVGGIGIVIQAQALVAPASPAPLGSGVYAPSAAAEDAVAGIMRAFDAATIRATAGQDRRFEVSGHEACSWGSSRVGLYTPHTDAESAPELLYSGQVVAKDRGWRRLAVPYVLGVDSQTALEIFHPRSTAWPLRADTRMRVDVLLPMVIIRSNGGAPSEEAKYCGPVRDPSAGYIAGGPGTMYG